MEKSLSFLLSSFLSFLLPSLCNALSSCPLSEAPSWPSSNPYGKNSLQEMSLSHFAHLAKCACETTRWYESEGTHLRIGSSRVQLAFNKTRPFLLDSWAFLGFLCAHVSSQTISTTEVKARFLQLWNVLLSPHAEGPLAGFVYVPVGRGSSLPTTPRDKYKPLETTVFS